MSLSPPVLVLSVEVVENSANEVRSAEKELQSRRLAHVLEVRSAQPLIRCSTLLILLPHLIPQISGRLPNTRRPGRLASCGRGRLRGR